MSCSENQIAEFDGDRWRCIDTPSGGGGASQYEFVDGNINEYDDHTHGMMVLSTMGGNEPGKIIGTAPEADYLLLRSEDVFSENLIEEYMWVCEDM